MVTRSILTTGREVDVSAADYIGTGAVFVGTSGDLKVDMSQGGTVTLTAVSGFLPIEVSKIYTAGTTATDIVVFN